jgi:hypothetical protein
MTSRRWILAVALLLLAMQGCAVLRPIGPQQAVAVHHGISETITLTGRIRKATDPASELLPIYYFLQLKVPLLVTEESGADASTCERVTPMERIDLWYGGYKVFADLYNRELTLTGRLDCPRGDYVFRDIDLTVNDGPLIRNAVRATPPHPLP